MSEHSFHARVRRHAPVFLRFLISGSLGSVVDFGLLLLGTRVFLWRPSVALFVSGICALVTVFLVNKFYTFRSRGTKTHVELGKFLLVYGTSAFLNYWLSLFFIHLGLIEVAAKALAIMVLLIVNYAGLHGFVFTRKSGVQSS